jgi:maleylacetoacetate isomerase
MSLILHHFHSSSTSFRVRIALNLKGLAYERVPVTLRFKDGDHDSAEFKELNPQGNVPVLVDGDVRVTQSLAIIDYLDRKWPEPALFPSDPAERAKVWSAALHVACEIQPPNNLRVERYLALELGLDADAAKRWRRHWISVGFEAIEKMIAPSAGRFAHGDRPSALDCCLVPQIYNSQRAVVALDLAPWPTIARVYDACLAHPAFDAGLPKRQPGFVDIKEH